MKNRLLNVLLITAMVCSLAVAFTTPVQAKGGGDTVYIVILQDDPVATYTGDIVGMPATKPGLGQRISAENTVVARYVTYLKDKQNRVLRETGISSADLIYQYTYSLNGFAAFMTKEQAAAVALRPGVARVMEDQLRQKNTDSTPGFLGIQDYNGPWAKGITGKGVVVGIIDTGIWPEHPSFADDGSMPEPPIVVDECNFGNTAQNPNDAPFECNNKLIGAREFLDTYRALTGFDPDEFDSARDDDGHGSHTSSTAAGNSGVVATIGGEERGVISGIAPDAHIVMYKALGNLGGYTSDLAAAIDAAVADGVDVINYSIGGGAGAIGADEIAFLFAADANVWVANSAGNSGPGAYTLGSPGVVPWLTTVAASTQTRTFIGTVTLGDGTVVEGVSVMGPAEGPLVNAADLGNPLCLSTTPFTGDVTGKIVICRRGSNARVDKGLAVLNGGGAGMILYNPTLNTLNLDNHWLPAVHIGPAEGTIVLNYLAANPGTATAALAGGIKADDLAAPYMASFSSRGPNPIFPDLIKPDVTAPGVNILAAVSPFPDPGFVPGQFFEALGGTSMASPHVAGVFALLRQVHPDWSAAMAKSALMTTAYQNVTKEDALTPADPFDFGAGHIRPGGRPSQGSLFDPGLVYDAGFYDYYGFLCDADPGLVSASTCAILPDYGYPTDVPNLNLPSIGVSDVPGEVTVARTVTHVSKSGGYRVFYPLIEAPEGFEVTVEPAFLRLRSGQSATFYVTITNVDAPVGEWRFGSLIWTAQSGRFTVYSPIAVKASLFQAPDEVFGEGAEGETSFDVKFGYTGEYTANPHGLVAATTTMGNVVQDPDQTFDPADGYSNAHTITVADGAFLRIVMPPEAAEVDADIDLFLFDPDGSLYTTSTSGGTNEILEVFLPEAGDWTLFVHGWAAPGGDTDYWFKHWVVPLTPGGSLSIVSAPTEATIGWTETVTVGWTGLAEGDYLGAVSHSNADGLLGLTLVNVTVPMPE